MAARQRRTPGPADLTPALLKLGVVISLGAIMMQLDMTMTNVATNTLLRAFAVPLTTIQWVGTGYLISMATVLPVGGWAMERFGARAVWTTSLTVFLVGSALCGLAWSAPSLIAFRVVQGLGGGLILPVAQSIMALEAGPQRLAKAMALFGLPSLLGPVLGPVLGGVIVTDLSWRWIFSVNLPICLLALVLSARLVPATRMGAPGRLDLAGLALLSSGSVGLVFGFAEAGRAGSFTAARTAVPMLLGVAMTAGFVLRSLYGRGVAVVDVRLLARRAFGTASAVMFLATIVMFGTMGLLPLYFQQVRGQSALHTGLLMIPFGVGMGASLIVSSRLVERLGARRLALSGLVLQVAGNLALPRLDAGTAYLLIGAVQVVGGMGTGTVLVPVLAASLGDLRGDQVPRGSTAIRVFQQLGGSLGCAVLFVVLQHRITVRAVAAGGRPDAGVLGRAFGDTFWWPVVFGAAALLAALFLPPATARSQPLAGSPTGGAAAAEAVPHPPA